MTSLTYDKLYQFNMHGLREICASNRDVIYNFNALKKQQVIKLLITKSNEGYNIVIPKFIFNNDKYVKIKFF